MMPVPFPVLPADIPDELKSRRQWVVWRSELRDGKPTKVPYDPLRTGRRASPTDPATWGGFDDALRAYEAGDVSGIGFVFTAGDPYCGIDLDNCRDPETGESELWAHEVIDDFDTYAEISPSGTGFKLFGRGRIPGDRRRTGNYEMYDSDRFFTVTGHRYGDTEIIADVQAPLDALYCRLFGGESEANGRPKADLRSPRHGASPPDAEFLDGLRRDAGETFTVLYDRGDWEGAGHPSQSEADLALSGFFASAGADAEGIDRLFRGSALMRPKWDRADYRERTIRTALNGGRKRRSRKKPPASGADPMAEARRMIDAEYRAGDVLTLRFIRGEFYRYGGGRYVAIDGDEMRAAVTRWLDYSYSGIKPAIVTSILDCLKTEAIITGNPDVPCWLGESPEVRNWIAVENGLLDIEAAIAGRPDAQRPHSPEFFSTVCLPYLYDPTADCPRWKNALNRNTGGDESLQRILQEWFGYCLLPTTDFQRFLMLHGEGGTGKSSTLAALVALLGRENVSAVPLERFGDRFALYGMLGKLANVAAEIGDIDKAAEGHLKSLTSGDPMEFDRKYRDPITAIPSARLVFSTNNLPRFTDKTAGLWRRMLLVPFDAVVPPAERIAGMDKPEWWQAQGELPGILNWALAGLKRLREQGGFTVSDRAEAAKRNYRIESNPAAAFLSEHYREDSQAEIRKSEIYGRYKQWCERDNYKPLSAGSFGKEVKRAFPHVTESQPRHNGRQVHCYVGIAVVNAGSSPF